MSLLSNANNKNKKDNKNNKPGAAANKTAVKPGSKAASFSKKPMKTGGTRGS